ncbi:glycine N-acyltransferase-like, partial [Gracilinanus agilis]|uniref:glycine N-acyltransferase-like n=1 Tax=Gracilinanus agilis TaxID=191870 RepID=UPI001CFDE164
SPNSNSEIFKMSSLDITHAPLVNSLWSFGGNEKSLKFIQRCIQHFPSYCLLGPEGTPVSWDLMDQTGELRMAGTLPEYRGLGLISHIIYHQIQALDKLGYPMYSHIDKDNQPMQRMSQTIKQKQAECRWQQWNCEPATTTVGSSAPKESESQSSAPKEGESQSDGGSKGTGSS